MYINKRGKAFTPKDLQSEMDNTHTNTLDYISDREVRLTRGCLNNKTHRGETGLDCFKVRKEMSLQLKEENDAMKLQR